VQRAVEIGLSGPDVYFNAGVLLMNLAAMRAGDSSRELLDFAVANAPNLGWRDQDTLNLVLGDRRLALHPRWNCMNATYAFREADDVFGAAVADEARRHPAIRHFEGPGQNKPWHYLADPAARELYMRHRAATPGPRFEAEGRTPRNVLRRATRGLRR
jgi:lipopolysaccharide biosynthesis glycosyltransferase